MSDLNAIEEQLKNKCGEEIKTIVEAFINDVKNLDKAYSNGINQYYLRKDNDDIWTDSPNSLGDILYYTLMETFGDSMLRHKSKELLDKLDVLS